MPGLPPEARVIFAEEFKRQVRRLSWRILTLAVPVLLLIALIVAPIIRDALSTDEPQAPLDAVGYVDNADVVLNLGLETGPIRYASRAEGIQAMLNDEIGTLFEMPGDYLETGEVQMYRQSGGLFSDESVAEAFRQFLTVELIAGQVEPDVLDRVIAPADYQIFQISEDGGFAEEAPDAQQAGEFFIPFIFAVLLMVAIFSGSGSLLQSVADEKENRMIEMVITSATPFSIMSGKVLALGLAGLVQVSVWVASAAFIAPRIIGQIPDAGELHVGAGLLLTVLLLFIAGYFLFAIVMAGMGAATTSVREASQISAIVTIPAVVPLWLSSLLISQPDGTVARVLSLIPITAPTAILIRLSAANVTAAEVAASLAIIAVTSLLLLWVSARIFRAGLLLYGQRMTIKNVWSALRHAD